MKAEEYHLSLRPLEQACCLAQSDWVCIKNPLIGWMLEGSFLWKTGVLLRHIFLVFRCRGASWHRHILVREFSTIPLLLVFPLLWPLRHKLFFMIHHNLQWAVRSSVERFGLKTLSRMGARWAIFETQDFQGLENLNIPSPQNLVFPHPVPEKSAGKKNSSRPVIGVAGCYRPEKGMDDLLRMLVKHFPDYDMVAGVPNPEAVKILSVKVVNTAADADYRSMLARCDVLVQNGERDSYFYRASGPLADAAACGTAIIAPDFPLLRHQITSPGRIGEVFQCLDEMPAAVRKAVESARSGGYDFAGYCAARSAQAVADRLDEFVRKTDG